MGKDLKHTVKDPKAEFGLALRVFRYFMPYKWAMFVALLASAVVSVSTAGTAWLIKPALDDIFINKDANALIYVPLGFIALTLLKGGGRYIQNWCMNYSALRVLKTLRQELFSRIINLPLRFYEEAQVGVLMSRVINDVAMIQATFPALIQIFRQVLTMLGLLFVVFQQDFTLACYALVVLPLAGFPFAMFSRALRRYGRKNAEITAGISGMLQELLSGIRVVKAFASEKLETDRFNKENSQIVNICMRQANVAELASPVMEFIGALGIGLVIWYGGKQVISGVMTPGSFFSFVAALVMLYDPIKALNGANMNVQNALAGAERVFGILDDPKLQVEVGGERLFAEPFKELVFENVSLSYGQNNIFALQNLTLSIKAGEQVALVGPSGAGKTTLVNLIPRFYELTSGRILLNGHDLADYDLASLRLNMALVSQEAFLFDMTVRGNIAYASEKYEDMPAITKAAQAAFAEDFILDMVEGYETPIGERGVKLSGGQKQRLTIARAILKNAPILILDEATSALDSESESIVQAALDNLRQGRTSIIIAHRLSTILNADRIVVMDQGNILDIGTHAELLGRCELYSRLYEMQFGQKS